MNYVEAVRTTKQAAGGQDALGTNAVPGDGTYADYYKEYVNRPHIKLKRHATRAGLHLLPLLLGFNAGRGADVAAAGTSDMLTGNVGSSGRAVGTAVGLLASALLYKPIKSFANSIGENEAWRYSAVRSGKLAPGKEAAV